MLAQAADESTTTTAPSPVEGLVDAVTNPDRPCDPDDLVCNRVYDWTDSERWANAAEWLVAKPLTIVLILLVAFVASRILRSIIRRVVERALLDPQRQARMGRLRSRTPGILLSTGANELRRDARAQALITVLRGLASTLVWFVALVAVLGQLEIQLGPLVAGAGIAGVALGFGAQNLVRDFLTGTFIILEDQYGVGDIVDLGDAVGTVEKVTLRVTRLRDVNGVVWHVPNGEITRVANQSQDWARALLDVDVAYDTDLDRARSVIEGVANKLSADPDWQAAVLEAPEVWGVENFGPDGVTMRVVIKTRPAEQWKVLRELRRRMKAAFDSEGIEIPFPQRTLWVRGDEAAAEELPLDGGGGSGAGGSGGGDGPSSASAGAPPAG
jgi:small conductance mechanosensitive channel